MLFLLNRLSGGRYGPALRAGLGVALVVTGLIASSKILILVGGVFIVWGIGSGIRMLTSPAHRSRPDRDSDSGGSISESEHAGPRR